MRVDKLIRLIDEYEDIEDKALILRSQINEELESRLDYEFGIETTTDGICFVYDGMNITVKSVGDLRDFFKLRKSEMRELLASKSF